MTWPTFLKRWRLGVTGFAFFAAAALAPAQIQLQLDPGPQVIFSGVSQTIKVRFRNGGPEKAESHLRTRLFQASSATAMPVSDAKDWKTLAVLGGQTVEEMFQVQTPPIRGEAKFILVWYEGDRQLGTIELWVWPKDLLKGLLPGDGERNLGLWDPTSAIAPALKAAGVTFVELSDEDQFLAFHGKLVLITGAAGERNRLIPSLQKKTAEGSGVVWLPPAARDVTVAPIVIHSSVGTEAAFVVAPMQDTENFAESAHAQVTLLRMADHATSRKRLGLASDRNR